VGRLPWIRQGKEYVAVRYPSFDEAARQDKDQRDGVPYDGRHYAVFGRHPVSLGGSEYQIGYPERWLRNVVGQALKLSGGAYPEAVYTVRDHTGRAVAAFQDGEQIA
jgi:hypothetical protein